MSLKTLLLTAALPASLLMYAMPANAQTACPNEITTAETRQVRTSTEDSGSACDVTIASTGSVTSTSGSAVVIDSNNSVTTNGNVGSTDSDDTVGIELQGGNTGDLTVASTISLTETTENTDADGDFTIDGAFAEGSGRTGILISGASPFIGNVTASTSSSIDIEGNNSFAFRLMETAGLTGDIDFGGAIRVVGGNMADGASAGALIEGDVTGDITQSGSMTIQGEGGSGIILAGDVDGRFTHSGTMNNTGYRFTSRSTVLSVPNAIDSTDNLQGGSAIRVNGDITGGVYLQREQQFDDEGNANGFLGNSQISQFGSAPAILFDGEGNNIMIGLVVPITDTDNTHLQYAFVNQGSVTSNGIYDDVSATGLEIRDATLENGISNSGTMTTETYRSSEAGAADTSLARVIVLGSGAIVDEINNSGLIQARVSENTAEIYADLDNPLAAQSLLAVAIDVDANASITSIINSQVIQATLVGRQGTAIAIRDASGTITVIDNTGAIVASGTTSDPRAQADVDFTTIAMDLSANTTGVTITQSRGIDTDTTDDIEAADPFIIGNVMLGSGDDSLSSTAGIITGDVSFGDGADVLTLEATNYTGTITDSDGQLLITLTEGSALNITTATPINATSASFDGTSSFNPNIDGATGLASTLITTGDITFAEGATISPTLSSVVDPTNNSFSILEAGGTLNFQGIVADLLAFDSPFMYDTSFSIAPSDPNSLLITLDLRSTEAMGLDGVQTAAFGTSYDALVASPDLARAFVNITDGNQFRSALNQLLPEFAAAARQFVVANVDGAVGAVGSHLDNARQSQNESGGAWIQEFTYFADRDLAGLSEQYRGFGFGFTGGLDTELGPFHTAGVNFGFASTEIEDVLGIDEPLDVMTFQGGLYGGLQTGDFSLDIYGGAGYNDFDQTRNVAIGTFAESAKGSWSGSHLNGSVRGGYDIALSKKFWARPAFSVDYLRLKENGYTETSTLAASAIALDVDGRTSEQAGATAVMNIGANFQGRRTWIRPSIRAGYRNEFINDGVTTTYGFAGQSQRATLISEAFPSDGILLGFSVAAGSGYSSFGFDFDSDVRDGFIRHTGRIILRMIF